MDMWRPTIYAGCCDARSTWRNRHALWFPMSCYCAAKIVGAEALMTTIPEPTGRRAAKVMGAEAIMTMILEPMGHRAYGICGTFRFCAAIPPFR
jgi:hypothetical protein